MEFQGEFPQPFLQSGEEPHGVILKLETRHEVVRIPHHDHFPTGSGLSTMPFARSHSVHYQTFIA